MQDQILELIFMLTNTNAVDETIMSDTTAKARSRTCIIIIIIIIIIMKSYTKYSNIGKYKNLKN